MSKAGHSAREFCRLLRLAVECWRSGQASIASDALRWVKQRPAPVQTLVEIGDEIMEMEIDPDFLPDFIKIVRIGFRSWILRTGGSQSPSEWLHENSASGEWKKLHIRARRLHRDPSEAEEALQFQELMAENGLTKPIRRLVVALLGRDE